MSTVLVVVFWRLNVSSWNTSVSGYGSLRVLYLLSTNRSISTLQSLGQQTKSLPSIALEVKGVSSASIQACALKLIWRLLQRVSSLLHRDVF